MKALHPLSLCLIAALFGCNSSNPAEKQDKAPAKAAASCDNISWPINTGRYDSLAATLPPVSGSLYGGIPKENPLKSKGNQVLGRDGNFWPQEGKYFITGGVFFSQIGSLRKEAQFHNWMIYYQDSSRQKPAGWCPCLTQGELIFPRKGLSGKSEHYFDNYYEATDLGDSLVLIRLDSTRGHRICVIDEGFYPTPAYPGSRLETQGMVLQRKADGWYCQTRKVGD